MFFELPQRKSALSIGEYILFPASGDLLSCWRRYEKSHPQIILLDSGTEASHFSIATFPSMGPVALSTHLEREPEPFNGRIALGPNEESLRLRNRCGVK